MGVRARQPSEIESRITMREIVKRPLAKNDLILAYAYLEYEAEVRVADRFLEAVEKAFETLASWPGMGVRRTHGGVEMQMLPVPKFTKYLIYYIPTDATLEVIRVLHGAQDIEAIFNPAEE